jgi:tetratricopeptide (TPR) repeat protein
LRSADTTLPIRQSRRLFITGVLIIVVLNGMRFAGYALDRKYSIMDAAESLRSILPDNVFLVGDCANTVALETKFQGLPAYGDLMRYNEKAEFERYPVTHFLLRYPALFNYLRDNYPDFSANLKPIRLYGLCGREATLLRFEEWPGYPRDSYKPTVFEQATDLLNEGMPDEAIQTFQVFLSQQPKSYEAFWGIAVAEMKKGDDQQAKAYIERALELTKRDALSYEVYADVLQNLGQHELAVKYWRKALTLSPGNRRILRKIGLAAPEPAEESSQ